MLRKILMAPEGTPAAVAPAAAAAAPSPGTPAAAPAAAVPAPAAAAPATVLTDPSATPPAQNPPQGVEPKGAPPAAAEFKITVPDGVNVNPKLLGSFTDFAKENKLTSEAAQKMVDQYVGAQQQALTEAEGRRMEEITTWAEEARNDPEIGGAKWEATVASARKGLARFGSPELEKLLTQTGLGNNKAVIKMFSQIASRISEDSLPGSGTAGHGDGQGVDPLRSMYPSMYDNKK